MLARVIGSWATLQNHAQLAHQEVSQRPHALLMVGAVAALTMPPVFFWPLLPLVYGLLFQAAHSAENLKQAFWRGWCWGIGYYLVGLYWIAHALLVDGWRFAWLIPLALTGIPAALAVYSGLAAVALRLLHINSQYLAIPAFAAIIIWLEWLRSWLFSGFPWNSPAYSLNFSDVLMQSAAWGGIYGSGFSILWIACFAWLALVESSPKRRIICASLSMLCLAGMMVYGAWRLHSVPSTPAEAQTTVRIVQPNIDQAMKWDAAMRVAAVEKLVELSREPGHETLDLVIWPETAVPFFLYPDFPLQPLLAQAAPPNGWLLTGAMRDDQRAFYNSLFVIGPDGQPISHYDKYHLVPFGEYVPLRGWLPLVSLVYGGQDFSSGQPTTLSLPNGLPFRGLICYEAIFGDELATGGTPRFLVNITNDAWFGKSTGPSQHMEAARLRAVEQGVPLVRAANNGISLATDAYGRVLSRLDTNQRGQLTVQLSPIADPGLYATHGHLVSAIAWFVCAAYWLTAARNLRISRYNKRKMTIKL